MQYLRRHYVPLLLGIGATLLVAALVAGIADLVTDEEPERRVSVGAFEFDLGQLEDAFRDFDFDDLRGLEALQDLPEIGMLLELLRGYLSGFDGFGDFGDGHSGSGASSFATDQPTLGVTIDAASGALIIDQVFPGTAAANAGLRSGDEILSVDGRAVDEIDALRDAIADVAPGRVYPLEVLRDGERRQFDVQPQAFVGAGLGPLFEQLGEQSRELFRDRFGSGSERALPEGRTPREGAPSQAPQFSPRAIPSGAPQLGISGVDADGGVRVAQVQPGSGADVAGVRAGDLITGVEGVSTRNIQELRDRLGSFAAGDSVLVTVARDGSSEELRVRLSPPALQSQAVPALGDTLGPFGGLLDEPSATSATAGRVLDQLADLVAARLAARGVVTDTGGGVAPTSIVAPMELETYFGRVESIDGDSIRLTGTLGGVTLTLTAQTVTIGSTQAAVGDLVTVVVRDRVVELLIVVG